MSDRNEATGQFTPTTEGLFGREYKNAKAGFTTKEDGEATPDYSDADPVREPEKKPAATIVRIGGNECA